MNTYNASIYAGGQRRSLDDMSRPMAVLWCEWLVANGEGDEVRLERNVNVQNSGERLVEVEQVVSLSLNGILAC